MQSSAQGKPIGADIFDNAVKAGGISVQYADRLKAKQGLIAPISEDQREAIRGVLEEQGIDEPGYVR
jgi:tagatose-1,6-bisphosphate aldolase